MSSDLPSLFRSSAVRLIVIRPGSKAAGTPFCLYAARSSGMRAARSAAVGDRRILLVPPSESEFVASAITFRLSRAVERNVTSALEREHSLPLFASLTVKDPASAPPKSTRYLRPLEQ